MLFYLKDSDEYLNTAIIAKIEVIRKSDRISWYQETYDEIMEKGKKYQRQHSAVVKDFRDRLQDALDNPNDILYYNVYNFDGDHAITSLEPEEFEELKKILNKEV